MITNHVRVSYGYKEHISIRYFVSVLQTQTSHVDIHASSQMF
jgi:hypothetical protein